MMIEFYYSGIRRRAFIYIMMSLFKNPNFEFTEFCKIEYNQLLWKDCTLNVINYKVLIAKFTTTEDVKSQSWILIL